MSIFKWFKSLKGLTKDSDQAAKDTNTSEDKARKAYKDAYKDYKEG